MSELQYDCTQSVMCRAQRGHTLEDDPIPGCVRATAKLLASDSSRQEQFLANFNNCALQVVCAYYDCAQADVASYGEIQLPKIQWDCEQNLQCQRDNAQEPMPSAMETCVASSVAAVSNLPLTRRPSYESTWENCNRSGVTSCAWVSCFMGF